MSATHAARTAGLIHGKQLDQNFQSDFQVKNIVLAADAASVDVTAAIAAWAATGGRNGTAVPVQLAAGIDAEGVMVTPTLQVQINNFADGLVPKDAADEDKEIYGRITEAANVYTVTFFKSDGAGGDAAYTMPAGSYNFVLFYSFMFHTLPANALIGMGRKELSQDPVTSGQVNIEPVAVTGLNTLANIVAIAKTGSIRVRVNNVEYPEVTNAGITVAGQTITWDPIAMGFPLETTDKVEVYSYL